MRSTRHRLVFVGKHSDHDTLWPGQVERAQAINVVLDGIEFSQCRINVDRCCRFTGCCRMHIGTGECVIEEAGSREPRLDAAFARQSEVLEAGNAAIDGEFSRQLRCKIGLYNIETVLLEQALPSHTGEPSACSFDLINPRHFLFSHFSPASSLSGGPNVSFGSGRYLSHFTILAIGTFHASSFYSRLFHHAPNGANSSNWIGAVFV